jgi:Ca-activated chloride channel family protein
MAATSYNHDSAVAVRARVAAEGRTNGAAEVGPIAASEAPPEVPIGERLLSLVTSFLLFCALIAAPGCGGLGESAAGDYGGAGSPLPPPSVTNAGDKYVAVGTNPFVTTSHDPLSTFAVDVDTASYDIFRRDVNLGMLPQPASVRLEEYVNDFSYDYPVPAAAEPKPFTISLGAASGLFNRGTALLRVGIQAFDPPAGDKRPTNLVFLVDVSGSMQTEDKLPLVQRILRDTLEILAPTDTVSIVSYAGDTQVRLQPTPVSESAKITAVIDGLDAAGSTAGAAGLTLAYDQARAGYIDGGINHILLCTDGDFNVGPATTDELLAIVKQQRDSGVTLTALGFGIGNLNDQMMEAISDAGNGVYGMISNPIQADRYASERMLSTLVHVANNMKVQVQFNPARVSAYRLLGYEDRAVADSDFRNDNVDGGEIGAGHRVTALYEVVATGQVVPTPTGAPDVVEGPPVTTDAQPTFAADDAVRVSVRYQAVGDAADAPAHEVNVSLPSAALGTNLSAADADLRWAASVAAYAEILKQSPFADRSALPTIETVVTDQAGRDADRTEFAQLFAKAKPMLQSMKP